MIRSYKCIDNPQKPISYDILLNPNKMADYACGEKFISLPILPMISLCLGVEFENGIKAKPIFEKIQDVKLEMDYEKEEYKAMVEALKIIDNKKTVIEMRGPLAILDNLLGIEKIMRAMRKNRENFPDHKISTFVVGPMTVLSALRPIEKLLRDLRKNPQGVKELLDFCFEANMKWAKAFKKEFGPTSVMVVDPVGCDDILSPKQVEEFSLPYLKKQLSAYYELNGIKANLYICGHTKKQWKYFKDLDIDFFSVDNCEDLEECKKEIEDKLIVVGNIPPVEVMRYGKVDDVIESVKTCIKKAADAKCGYIAATGCGSPVKTPIENLDAFIYAINKYGKNAKLGEMPEAINE